MQNDNAGPLSSKQLNSAFKASSATIFEENGDWLFEQVARFLTRQEVLRLGSVCRSTFASLHSHFLQTSFWRPFLDETKPCQVPFESAHFIAGRRDWSREAVWNVLSSRNWREGKVVLRWLVPRIMENLTQLRVYEANVSTAKAKGSELFHEDLNSRCDDTSKDDFSSCSFACRDGNYEIKQSSSTPRSSVEQKNQTSPSTRLERRNLCSLGSGIKCFIVPSEILDPSINCMEAVGDSRTSVVLFNRSTISQGDIATHEQGLSFPKVSCKEQPNDYPATDTSNSRSVDKSLSNAHTQSRRFSIIPLVSRRQDEVVGEKFCWCSDTKGIILSRPRAMLFNGRRRSYSGETVGNGCDVQQFTSSRLEENVSMCGANANTIKPKSLTCTPEHTKRLSLPRNVKVKDSIRPPNQHSPNHTFYDRRMGAIESTELQRASRKGKKRKSNDWNDNNFKSNLEEMSLLLANLGGQCPTDSSRLSPTFSHEHSNSIDALSPLSFHNSIMVSPQTQRSINTNSFTFPENDQQSPSNSARMSISLSCKPGSCLAKKFSRTKKRSKVANLKLAHSLQQQIQPYDSTEWLSSLPGVISFMSKDPSQLSIIPLDGPSMKKKLHDHAHRDNEFRFRSTSLARPHLDSFAVVGIDFCQSVFGYIHTSTTSLYDSTVPLFVDTSSRRVSERLSAICISKELDIIIGTVADEVALWKVTDSGLLKPNRIISDAHQGTVTSATFQHFHQNTLPERNERDLPCFSTLKRRSLDPDSEPSTSISHRSQSSSSAMNNKLSLDEGHKSRSTSFEIENRVFATGSLDATVKLWDTSMTTPALIFLHSNPILSIAFGDRNAQSLIVGQSDGNLAIWDMRFPFAPVLSFSNLPGNVISLQADHRCCIFECKLSKRQGHLLGTLDFGGPSN